VSGRCSVLCFTLGVFAYIKPLNPQVTLYKEHNRAGDDSPWSESPTIFDDLKALHTRAHALFEFEAMLSELIPSLGN
jgi:hypothetical protein